MTKNDLELTPCRDVLLEDIVVSHLVRDFPYVLWSREFHYYVHRNLPPALLPLLQALQLQSLNVLAFSTIFFPFMSVLDAVLPIIYFHDIQVIFYIILPPLLGLPNYLFAMGFSIHSLFLPSATRTALINLFHIF